MTKKSFMELEVVSSKKITPHMQRVVFGGEDLASFPKNQESGYIKLLFSSQGKALTSIADVDSHDGKVLMRTYTVRAFDASKQELTVDFALHPSKHSSGPASSWAASAKLGDTIIMAGPGPKKLVNNNADWFILVGDMTSLPAISCNLEQLPSHARGYVVIEIIHEQDKQTLIHPEGVKLMWLVKPKVNTSNNPLLSTVKKLLWLEGEPYVWAACEFEKMRVLRQYFKKEKGINKNNIYISSYWKAGRSEEEHKIDKRMDMSQSVMVG